MHKHGNFVLNLNFMEVQYDHIATQARICLGDFLQMNIMEVALDMRNCLK